MPVRGNDKKRFRFGPFEFEATSGRLRKYGTSLPAQRQPLELLRALLEKPGQVVTREELRQRLWPTGLHVEFERSLNRCVNKLRTLLSDRASKPRYIETVAGVGYRLMVNVEILDHSNSPDALAANVGPDLRPAEEHIKGLSLADPEALPADLHTQLKITPRRMGARSAWAGLVLTIVAGVLLVGVEVWQQWPLSRTVSAKGRIMTRTADSGKAAGAGRLFVLNEKGHSVSIVNPLTNRVESTISMPSDPRGVAILRDGSLAYISLNGANGVVALNTRTGRIVATVPAGNNPVGVAANPRPPFIYVANNYSNSISVIDSSSNRLVRELQVGSVPTEIAVNPEGTRAIVTNQSGGNVTLIDCVQNEVLATIPVGATPVGVAFTLDSRLAWVTLAGQGEVAIIDLAGQRVIHRVTAGPSPIRVAIGLGGQRAVISNFFSNTVTVLDTSTLQPIGTITVGLNPVGIVFDPAGKLAYVANYGSNSISVMDVSTLAIVRTINVGAGPVEMAVLACFIYPCSGGDASSTELGSDLIRSSRSS